MSGDADIDVPWVFGQTVMTLMLLPLDPDEIAAYLGRLGYQGRTGSRADCALSAYLRDRVDMRQYGVKVELDQLSVEARKGDRTATWALPQHLSRFVRALDAGEYPHLEQHHG